MYGSDPHDIVYLNRKSEVFKNLRKRYIVDERVIRKLDFEVNNMIDFQESRSLMHAFEYAKHYFIDWVAEYYVNLKPSAGSMLSSNFGKIRLKNNIVVINPGLINNFLRTRLMVEEMVDRRMVEEMVDNINEVLTMLTSGNYTVWTLQFPATNLTSLYSVLHKLTVTNWLPSKNSTILTEEQNFNCTR